MTVNPGELESKNKIAAEIMAAMLKDKPAEPPAAPKEKDVAAEQQAAQDKHESWIKFVDEAIFALEDPEATEAVLVVCRKNGTEIYGITSGSPLFVAGAGVVISGLAAKGLKPTLAGLLSEAST